MSGTIPGELDFGGGAAARSPGLLLPVALWPGRPCCGGVRAGRHLEAEAVVTAAGQFDKDGPWRCHPVLAGNRELAPPPEDLGSEPGATGLLSGHAAGLLCAYL